MGAMRAQYHHMEVIIDQKNNLLDGRKDKKPTNNKTFNTSNVGV